MPKSSELKPSGTAHIYLDERGRGWVADTNVRVDQIVADVIGPEKMTPERVIEAYPHAGLTLAQIHAALAWYYDHQAEMDAQFARELERVEASRLEQRKRPQYQKIVALKAARQAGTDGTPD